MTVNKRIGELESRSPNVVDDHAETLASLLGAVDALFFPLRTSDNLAQVEQLRRRYIESGMTWSGSSGGGSSRAWKSDQRLRQSMASAGLVKLTKTKSNLPLVRLTLEAEQQTRAMIGLPTLADLGPRAVAIRLRLGSDDGGPEYRPGGWCCETWLFNSNYKDRPKAGDWYGSTDLVLPLLVAGVVVSRPSTVKQVFYLLTDRPLPGVEQPQQEIDESLQDIYLDAFDAGVASHAQLPKTHEVSIPLSATR